MSKKNNSTDTTTWRRDKADADKSCIERTIIALNGVQGAKPALDILDRLKGHAGQRWLELKEIQYAYADEIYSNRHWLTENQKELPPGTTFLGIVLDKTLEVSVVETFKSNSKRKYHRPMSILPKGAIFGTFETADLMCQTELLQDYTLFSGLRTFFFADPTFEPNVVGRAEFKKAMETIAKKKDCLADWSNINNDLSPTQTSLFFLHAFLDEKLKAWKSKILFIAIGSEFLANVSDEVKQVIWRGAWRQSAHLRQQTIAAYSTDEILEILGGNTRAGKTKVSEKFRSAIARELKTLPMLLTESRPGFRKIIVGLSKNESPDKSQAIFDADPETNAFGPFGTFFATFENQRLAGQKMYSGHEQEFIKSIERAVYVPQFLFDNNGEMTFPFWPNYDPSGTGGGKSNDDFKDVLRVLNPYWTAIKDELLDADLGYSKSAATLKMWDENDNLDKIKKTVPCLLRGPVHIQDTTPQLPLFAAVERLQVGKSAMALIGVQHLMEETICLLGEVIKRKLVEAKNIWLLGKPYSSNQRVAHRLSQLGITVTIPNEGTWFPGGRFAAASSENSNDPGTFDKWFDDQVSSFLAHTLAQIPKQDDRPILLLDDGGALIKAAGKTKNGRRFRGVEQTSRGIASACLAIGKTPVVLVACSAVKSVVEPEFVARAAVKKIAQYYPEALRLQKVGIIGFGNLAKYLACYIKLRPDIHDAGNVDLDVFCFDRNRKPDDLKSTIGWCPSAAELFSKADLVYGCSGEDYGEDAQAHGKAGQLLISLSSGDIEFATLLQSMNLAERNDYDNQRRRHGMLAPVKVGGKIVAHGGFPITFDRSPSSAPLVEMQLTRALLLAGIQQALCLETQSAGTLPLCAEAQFKIWTQWEQHAIESNKPGNPQLPELRSWQQQREQEFRNSSELKKRPQAPSDKKDVELKSNAFFKDATERFSQKTRTAK